MTYRSDLEKTKFLQDLNKLPATGGLDCPEPTFKGMLNALNYGPKYGSPMFVFTDATSKDDTLENMEALKQKANSLSCKIFFFTNTEGCKSGNKQGIESFKDIASFTSGLEIANLFLTSSITPFKMFLFLTQAAVLCCSSLHIMTSKSERLILFKHFRFFKLFDIIHYRRKIPFLLFSKLSTRVTMFSLKASS